MTRFGLAALVMLAVTGGCGGGGAHDHRVGGTVWWSPEAAPERVDLETAFFFPDPQPGLPGQILVMVTNVETTCEDAADWVIDGGGWPKSVLVLVVTGSAPGEHTLLGLGGDPAREFGGSLDRLEEDGAWQCLGIGQGTLRVETTDDARWEAEIAVGLIDSGLDRAPAGDLSGWIRATTCATAFD
jgi:hypothetical protein